MKLVVFGESDADELVLGSLVRVGRAEPVELARKPRLQSRGWPSVRNLAPNVIRHTHYQTDATGLLILFDSNGSPVHQPEHEASPSEECRVCQVRAKVHAAVRTLAGVAGRGVLNIAVACAVPSIEAWLLAPSNTAISEAAWINGQKQGSDPFTRLWLKEQVYGTSRPARSQVDSAAQAFADDAATHLALLRTAFPVGLARALSDVATW